MQPSIPEYEARLRAMTYPQLMAEHNLLDRLYRQFAEMLPDTINEHPVAQRKYLVLSEMGRRAMSSSGSIQNYYANRMTFDGAVAGAIAGSIIGYLTQDGSMFWGAVIGSGIGAVASQNELLKSVVSGLTTSLV